MRHSVTSKTPFACFGLRKSRNVIESAHSEIGKGRKSEQKTLAYKRTFVYNHGLLSRQMSRDGFVCLLPAALSPDFSLAHI